jgi:hypothetical protein
MKENLMKIMALFPNTVFLRRPLSRYIMQLPMKRRNYAEKHVTNIILFFDQLLRRFPDNYAEIPLDSLVVASMSLDQSVQVTTQVQVGAFDPKFHVVQIKYQSSSQIL